MKILLVEKDRADRASFESTLRRDGHLVESCPSGREALKAGQGWDLVISAEFDGLEALRAAGAAGSAEVILMSQNPAMAAVIAALQGGACDFLIKPFRPEALLESVQRCQRKISTIRERRLVFELGKAADALERMAKMGKVFGQFATPEVAQFVLENPPDFRRLGEHKTVSILFADVRSFTPFVGRVTPDEAVLSLNEVLSYVIAAVLRERGIVNKFTGDGLLAIFGAPLAQPDHAAASARAAIWARDSIETLANMRRDWRIEHLRLGFGINSGEVVAGCLGNRERAEYSVFGHAVNIAARLEEAAKPGQILIGPGTIGPLQGKFELGPVEPLDLPGMKEPVLGAELLKGLTP